MKKGHELFAEYKHIFGGSFPETDTADRPLIIRCEIWVCLIEEVVGQSGR